MRFRVCFILFLFLITSCKSKVTPVDSQRQQMFDAYQELHSTVREGNFDAMVPLLHQKSKSYYNKITDPKNLNLDSIISIGMKYKVPYFSMKYLGSCGDYMKEESSDPTDFFKYLTATNLSIFSDDIDYRLYEEESRLEKDAWVAIYKKSGEVNKVGWIKFVRPDSTTYEYDLIYNLKLRERMNRKIFKAQRKKHAKLTDEEFIRMYFPTFDNQECLI